MSFPPHLVRRVPMSSAQRRLYLQCQLPGGDRAYHLVYPARLRGPFSLDAVQAFAERMVERHEALRCAFRVDAGAFVCEVHKQVPFSVTVLDGEGFDPERDLDALVEACDQPFDLALPPLFRAVIRRCGPDDLVLVFVCHHLIFDGYSAGIVAKDINDTLAGEDLVPAERGYADFVGWENAFFDSSDYVRQRDFWLSRYKAPPARLSLPLDYPRPGRKSFAGASFIRYLDSRAVKALSASQGVTLFMTLLAAFYCTLFKLTGQTEITLGTLISPREGGGFQNVVGLFANTLPLTERLDAGMRFSDVLRRVRDLIFGALQNAEFPFEHLVNQLPFVERGVQNPLLDVVFNFERSARRRVETFGGVTIEPLDCYAKVAMFDFSVDLVEYENEVRFRVEYATALFRAETMQGLMEGYFEVVRQICRCPDIQIGEMALVSDEAWKRIAAWNDTARPIDAGTVLDLWKKQAAEQAGYPAVRLGADELTYGQMEARSNRLAQMLIRRGLKPGAVAAVALAAAIDGPVVLLAIWKAGGVYLPLSADLPAARLAHQLSDSAAALVITHAARQGAFAGFPAVVTIESLAAGLKDLPAVDPGPGAAPGEPAYIIYTSGSTGTPKGVVVDHRAIHTHIDAVRGLYRLQPDDNVLQFAQATFDASLEQVLATLTAGACLVLIGTRLMTPRALLDELDAQEITVAEFPPAYLRELLPALGPRSFRRLRRLISGGDALDGQLADELLRFLPAGSRLLNFYGPTEAAMAASVFAVPADLTRYANWPSLPIGKPLSNTRFHITGPGDELLPPGVSGELCIAGDRLARGYLNQPDLTVERFRPLGRRGALERAYKTGDRARWLDDGNVEFLGRLDRQVKLRGYRIELGEIEQALLGHPDVREAVVVKQGDEPPRLTAFVVARTPKAVESHALYGWLQERLPVYMIPAAIVVAVGLPRNAAGKVDLAALPAMTAAAEGAVSREMPVDPVEWSLWRLWRRILKTADIGRNDLFFRIGGNSLTAIQVMVEVKNGYGVELPLSLMLKAPTIAGIAEVLRGAGAAETGAVALRGEGGGRPLVLLPGLGGQFLDLYALSGHLDAAGRCFGIQYPGGGPGAGCIDGLARYLEGELDAQVSLAGSILLGHSFGGYVAVELARRLESRGGSPKALVLLDVAPPQAAWRGYAPSRRDLIDLAVWALLGRRDLAIWPVTAVDADPDDAALRALALLKNQNRIANTVDVAAFMRELDVLAERAASLSHYRLAVPLAADIHLFRAEGGEGDEKAEDWDWSPHTSGVFRQHWVPGGHFDMIKGHHAAALADLIKRTVLLA